MIFICHMDFCWIFAVLIIVFCVDPCYTNESPSCAGILKDKVKNKTEDHDFCKCLERFLQCELSKNSTLSIPNEQETWAADDIFRIGNAAECPENVTKMAREYLDSSPLPRPRAEKLVGTLVATGIAVGVDLHREEIKDGTKKLIKEIEDSSNSHQSVHCARLPFLIWFTVCVGVVNLAMYR